MQVPFLDLKTPYKAIAGEINCAVREVLESAAFAGGPFVERFEEEFARFCGCKHAIGVGNGTDALWFSLLALGIGPGDEVITVPNTFIATAEAISFCGAKPVFVDVEEKSFTMDPALLEAAITPRTRAVIPVHLFGQPADMDPILEVARRYDLHVIEDACQAHGARYKGKPAGSMGDTGCFSFYPGKNLGAYGEAGAVVTNDTELATAMKMLRDHGQSRKYHHGVIGWNGRMDGIQGGILSVKLRYLPQANEARRKNAALYSELLGGVVGIGLPLEMEYASHVYHLYVIRVKERDALMKALADQGIACGIHYPVPVHLQEAYRFLGHRQGSFPVAEACAADIVSLPMFPELSSEQIHYVADALRTFHVPSK
jgi:dTDP-4-amino-4,6-dideoxygalactose transaminase